MRYEFHPDAELELYEAASRYESDARRDMKAPSGAMRLRLIAPALPGSKIGTQWRFDRDRIDEWMDGWMETLSNAAAGGSRKALHGVSYNAPE